MERKLKILLVGWSVYTPDIPELASKPNGGGIAIYDIAKGIGQYEDVTLFLGQKPLRGRQLENMYLVDTEKLYSELSTKGNACCNDFLSQMTLIFEKVLLSGNFDIINFQGVGDFENKCIDICNRYNMRCVTTDHLFIGKHSDYEVNVEHLMVEDILFNMPKHKYIAVSNGERHKILREYTHLSTKAVFAIPNGIKMDFMNPNIYSDKLGMIERIKEIAHGRKILICSGAVSKRKNQLQLVHAWKYLPEKVKGGLIIFFCGKDSLDGKLEETIKVYNFENSIKYLGLLTPSQSIAAYMASDGMISVSRAEGLSLALLEGMSCGKPLIFHRDSECADDIDDTHVVTIIDENSDRSVADAIVKWYDGVWEPKYIKQYAEKKFSRDRMIKQYVDVFHEIVK